MDSWKDINARKKLEEDIKQRTRALSSMNIISSSVTKGKIKIDQFYAQVGTELSKIVRADTYYFGLLNNTKDKIDLKFIQEEGRKQKCRVIPIKMGITEWLVKPREPVFTNNLSEFRKKNLKRIPVLRDEKASLSWIGVPLIIDDDIVIEHCKSNGGCN